MSVAARIAPFNRSENGEAARPAGQPSGEGRGPGGRFAKGNAGGPARPRRPVEQQYLAALSDVVTLERWRAVCERAVADAEAGDHRAREWLASFVLAKAPSLVNLLAAEIPALTSASTASTAPAGRSGRSPRQLVLAVRAIGLHDRSNDR